MIHSLLQRSANIRLIVAIILLLCGCTSVSTPPQLSIGSAQVQLFVPASLDILRINDQKVNSPNIASGHYQLNLPAGRNSLEIQYTQNWNQADDAGYYVKWQPVLLNAEFSTNTEYYIDHQKPNNREQAVAWSKSPRIWLIANDKTHAKNEQISTSDSSHTDQAKLNAITNHHKKILAQPVLSEPNVIERFLSSSEKPPEKADAQFTMLTELKQRWRQANDTERALFKRWINLHAAQPLEQHPQD